ncbi:MAG: TIGR00701 family protein [Legionellales bacterium]|nr:TIGR00701 family protein [Legionellales bacterium]|tara:strand:+ start:1749 stop:2180 length:432 start_codon:yes stop_codon:yes gene_type:complete
MIVSKIIHLIAMVTWFSGLFYLPRLFVYHASATDAISLARFKVMERKLYYGITWPGACVTTLAGGGLLHQMPQLITQPWMQLKMLCLCALWAYHLMCGHYLKAFKEDRAPYTHIFYRWFNEIPVIFLIAIITLAVQKPALWGG